MATVTLQKQNVGEVTPPTESDKFRFFIDEEDGIPKVMDMAGRVFPVGRGVISVPTVEGPATYDALPCQLIPVDVGAGKGDVLINLPVLGPEWKDIAEILIKMVSLHVFDITVDGNGPLIDGAATSPDVDEDYAWMLLRFDGANWMQIG